MLKCMSFSSKGTFRYAFTQFKQETRDRLLFFYFTNTSYVLRTTKCSIFFNSLFFVSLIKNIKINDFEESWGLCVVYCWFKFDKKNTPQRARNPDVSKPTRKVNFPFKPYNWGTPINLWERVETAHFKDFSICLTAAFASHTHTHTHTLF